MKPVNYNMEELLPLVAKLAFKYTSGESSSVSYETANMLMEAVCYCIRENGREDEGEAREFGGGSAEKSGESSGGQECRLQERRQMTAAESYRQGFERVLEKTRRAQERYNELTADFRDYGNGNYRDTVLKALPVFFLKYDPGFAPQETVIGLDYPTLQVITEETGIDAVARYLEFIRQEQKFFRRLPEGLAEGTLTRFHEEYRELFCNLCRVPLRHMLASALLGRQPGPAFTDGEYAELVRLCSGKSREALTEILNRLTERLVVSGWGQDQELLAYLRGDTGDFVAELTEGVRREEMKYVVV